MSQKTKMLVSNNFESNQEKYVEWPIERKPDTSPATMALHKVELLLTEVAGQEASLDYNWVKLSVALEEVQVKEYWRGKYNSFGAYLKETCEKYKRGRSQMYNYIAVAHQLLPVVTEDQIIQMGIAKAQLLADSMKTQGSFPTEALTIALEAGKTAENVKEALFKGANKEEKGEWYPLSGFPVNKDEKATLDLFFETARRTDPPMPKEWKPWQILKECLLRGAMEYNSTYPDVETYGDEAVSF